MSFWEMLLPAAMHPDPYKIRGGIPSITPNDVRAALGGLGERPFLFGMAAFLGHTASMVRLEQLMELDILDMAEAGAWGTTRAGGGDNSVTGELTRKERDIVQRLGAMALYEAVYARSRHDTYAHEAELPARSVATLCPECNGRGDTPGSITRAGYKVSTLQRHIDQTHELLWSQTGGPAVERDLRTAKALLAEAAANLMDLSALHPGAACGLCEGTGRFVLTDEFRAEAIGISRRGWFRKWDERYAEVMLIPQDWEAIAVGHVRKKLSRGGA